MHLSEQDLAALLHNEAKHPAFSEHLANCADCGVKFRVARVAERTTAQQLAYLDHPVPQVSARAVMVPRNRSPAFPLKRIAAGVTFLFLAVGAAAAVPASPLHRLLRDVVADLKAGRTGRVTRAEQQSTSTEGARPARSHSGVLFVPDSSLEVVFRQYQSSGTLRVTLVNAPLVSLNSLGGSSSFDLGRRQIYANNTSASGSYGISIPTGLTRVLIRVGPETVFTRVGSEVRTVAARTGNDTFVLALSPADWKTSNRYRVHVPMHLAPSNR